jgi:hypothetical protein
MAERRLALDDGSLVDALDRLVTTGAAVDGSLVITLAGVDLARLDLRLLLTAARGCWPRATAAESLTGPAIHPTGWHAPPNPLGGHATDQARATSQARGPGPQGGLAGLVVAVVDVVRQLLERLALRRMAADELSTEEVEWLGRSLMALEDQTTQLATLLGLAGNPGEPMAAKPIPAKEYRR